MVSRSRLFEWVTAVAVAVVFAAGVTAVIVRTTEDEYPSEWDARVLDLAQFVERERGALFDHPVPVDFLTADEYSERTRTDEGSLSEEEAAEIEQFEGEMRALGILSGDTSLIDATNDLTDTGTLAYYDSFEEQVVVRGTEVTPGLAVTLVHELTHVLQDQVFALDRYREADEEPLSGETFAFDSLVEGDADRIEQRYVESLDQATQDAIEEENAAGFEDFQAATGEVPAALSTLFGAIYGLGDSFIAVLDEVAGESVDSAFDDPPISEEQVFDPFAYFDGDDPTFVDVPDTGGEDAFDDGDFGAVSLMVVLAERIDPRLALAAATGWGGDAYVVFPRDDRTCIRLDVTGDDEAETDELADALAAWVEASPDNSTTSRDGDIVHLESCDPGPDAAGGTGGSALALELAVTRTYVAVDALDEGASREEARCFGSALVLGLTDEELIVDEPTPATLRKAAGFIEDCQP